MLQYIPFSVLYALPLIPIIIIGKILYNRSHAVIAKQEETQTNLTAADTVRVLLDNNKLKNIAVEQGNDWSFNGFDDESGKIKLSPGKIAQKDIVSIAVAVLAFSPLLREITQPPKALYRKISGICQPISFWTVFTILALGLMSSSVSTVLFGYLLSLTTIAFRYYNLKSDESAAEAVIRQLESLSTFCSGELENIRKATGAILRTNH